MVKSAFYSIDISGVHLFDIKWLYGWSVYNQLTVDATSEICFYLAYCELSFQQIFAVTIAYQ